MAFSKETGYISYTYGTQQTSSMLLSGGNVKHYVIYRLIYTPYMLRLIAEKKCKNCVYIYGSFNVSFNQQLQCRYQMMWNHMMCYQMMWKHDKR